VNRWALERERPLGEKRPFPKSCSEMGASALIGTHQKDTYNMTKSLREVNRKVVELRNRLMNQESAHPSPQGDDGWAFARETFPVTDFPSDILPPKIEKSLHQLSRSYATNFATLPGAILAVLCGTLGATVRIKAKPSWSEILSLWFADISPSGTGKTHAPRAACSLVYQAQERSELEYRALVEAEDMKPAKDRVKVPRARGYFATDVTLEGVRSDVAASGGHGGLIVILDELATFMTAQNQYKKNGQGSDGQMWLAIYDGKPGRAARSGDAAFIKGARVSIFGGIQPEVWRSVFGGKAHAISDGTIPRFLPVVRGEAFIPVGDENWVDAHRDAWESTLKNAMAWADERCSAPEWEAHDVLASKDAWGLFRDWTNDTRLEALGLPVELRPFVNKMPGHALRLAGALHCLSRFSEGLEPGKILTPRDIDCGIRASQYYAGQMVEALCMLVGEAPGQAAPTDMERRLAEVLEGLRAQTTIGKLAVGHICTKYNNGVPGNMRVGSPRGMGSLLRSYGLTIPEGLHDANGSRRCKCLVWDEKTEEFLRRAAQ